jgi:TP901 family phage tail tape measure protein
MATPFNLTARLNIQGPIGIKPVVDTLRRQLKDVRADIKINLDQKVNANLATLNKTLAETDKRIKSIEASSAVAAKNLNALGVAANKTASAQNKNAKSTAATNTVLAKTAKGAAEAASEVQEFGRVSGLAIRRFAGFTIATSVVFGFINAVQQATREAIDFQREVARIAQVTGNSIQGIAGLEKEVTRLSTTLGVSSAELILAARTLNQAGFAANEAKVALEALAKSSLAPTFKDIKTSTEGAIATLRQFKLEARDLESVLGSINAVAGQFAVESDDILNAIRRTGGVFQAASNPQNSREAKRSLQEFIALFTSVRSTTRESAESIATGLRTIFTRIQRRGTIEALRELNVELESGGKFVGPFEAVKRLSVALKDLSTQDIRFSPITEELGGFRQIGKTIPLIKRFDLTLKALNTAQQGQDSLTRDAAVAQETLQVQIEKTRQRFLALIRDITKTDTFKTISSGILTAANALIKFGKTLEPIIPALTAFAAVKSVGVVRNFLQGFGRGVSASGGAAGLGERVGGGGRQQDTRNQNTAATQANTQAVTESTKQERTSDTASKSLRVATDNNTVALKKLDTTIGNLVRIMASNPIGGGGAGRRRFATGGLVPGMGDGDRIPFLGMGGEFVVNRKGVKKAGLGALMGLNTGGRPQKLNTGERVNKVLAGTGAASDFESILGKEEFNRLLSQQKIAKKSQLRRNTNPKAFAAIQAEAQKKAQTLSTQSQQDIASIPQFSGPGGVPAIAGIFAESKSVGNILSTTDRKEVLSILRKAGLIGDKTQSVNMPIFPAFLDEGKSQEVIGIIQDSISGTVAQLAGSLGRSIAPDDPLLQRLISTEGINLQDAAGKLFEAGLKSGLRLDQVGGQGGIDFPNRGQVEALQGLYGPIPSGVADAKLRANSDSYRAIRVEYARFLAKNAAPRQKRATGGSTNMRNVLLTPGELVFDP